MHETIHHIQHSIREEIGRQWPWDPHWFSEGMAEYEGILYIIDHYKPKALERLFESLERADRRYKFSCCWGLSDIPQIQFGEVYNSANLFMRYLAEEFGEEIHNDLMRYEAQSFAHGLVEELAIQRTTLPDVFRGFQVWVEDNQPLPGNQPIARVPIAKDTEDAERLRRLVELLRELLLIGR